MKYLLIAVFCLACTPDEAIWSASSKQDTVVLVSNKYDSFLVFGAVEYHISKFGDTTSFIIGRYWVYKPKVVFINYGHNLLWDTCGGRRIKNKKDYERILDTSKIPKP